MRDSDRVLLFVSVLFLLPWLCVATTCTFKSWNPIDSVGVGRRAPRSSFLRRSLAGNSTAIWNTIDGNPPLVIANGGSSGLLPDQTAPAYHFAKNNSLLSRTALLCDLQLTADGYGLCRTGINLGESTTVNITYPQLQTTHDVNGKNLTGYFAVDMNGSLIFNNLTAMQSNPSRPPAFNEMFSLLDPSFVFKYSDGGYSWINVEYPGFYSQFDYNMSAIALSLLEALPYDYLSSPEVAFLKAVSKAAPNNTNLVLRFHGKSDVEPSTNVTYESLLSDLKTIATYAAGIMVPKDYVWPVDTTTEYLGTETTLVKDAHDAGLAIYVSEFLTDQNYAIYNYSFDPIREYLQYVLSTGSNVDGFLTDFPSTASEALACYRTPPTTKAVSQPLVISHNGASGDYPGCTMLAYEAAVKDGANIIDCSVQITSDGVAVCRESANLLISTNVSTSSFFPARVLDIPELGGRGLYTFNMTWNDIQTYLKATIYTPGPTDIPQKFLRNPANDGTQRILSFTEFLTYAQNQSTGILIDIQNAYFLETQLGLNVLQPVISTLSSAGLNNSNQVIIQSEDSSVLKYLKEVTNFTLVYRVTSTNVTITAKEVKEIKDQLADHVTLPRGLIQRSNNGFLMNSSGVVQLFHDQNMTVYVSFLRNAFTDIAFDYEADPTMELNSMVNFFKVDGLFTDFPATASAFLSKECVDYTMRFVIPGELATTFLIALPPLAAGDPLDVTKNESPFGANPEPSTPAGSSPSSSPSNSFRTPVPYFLVILAIFGSVFHSLLIIH